ncbi:MAG: hypothetical protein V5A23_04360 [Halobacteriales archaeon]
MATGTDPGSDPLTPAERERLAALRGAGSLAELRSVVGGEDDHDAYFAAKEIWRDLRAKQLSGTAPTAGLPGNVVAVGGHRFHVHGVTHADTPEEGDYLREHVRQFLDDGAAVYVEQGIRPMYFAAFEAVCEMDDYRWAMDRCRALDGDSRFGETPAFDSVGEQLDSLTDRVREAVFSLLEAEASYGDGFRSALGDLASDFLTSHETMATGEEFASYTLTRAAARDPDRLGALQRYYETAFLPPPIEREWLRRHDPELELVTHARSERQADYAVYHNDDAREVHLVVGAAHQPGVTYYLERHRDGHRSASEFEPVA